ncbi:unnamed protein product [Brassica napus]|uniref:Uncharacterized protein n=2 Tax=Brassica TaxID=3705 RepID=A0A3P6DX47_BRAOL|nr:unnamed protein product [Brassica napus]VDD36267.1 unnamed protein product [Brassica oleracea]
MIFRGWDPGTDSESPIPVVCSQKVDVGKKGKRDRDLTRSSSEDLHGSGLDKGRKGSGRWRKSSILSNWIWIWILVTIKAISQIRRGMFPVVLNSWRRRVHQTPNKGHQKPSFMNQVNLLEWLCQQVMGMVSVFKLLIFLISSMSTLVSSVLGVGMVSFLFCYACWYPISHVLRMQWNKIYVLDCLVWCFLERNDIKRISRWLSLRIEDWHQWIIILLLDFVGFILGLFSVSEKWMCLVSSNQTQVRSPYTYSKFYGNMPIIGVYSGQQRAQPNRYYDFYVCILVVIAMRFGGPHMFTDWRKNGIVGYFFLLLVLINHYGDCYILFNVVLYWCLVICWKICEKLESWCFLWMFQGKFLWDGEIVKLISLKALTCWRAYLLWGLENSGYHYTQFSQLKGAFLYIF